MYVIASEYLTSFLSLIFAASFFIVRVAEGPMPPRQDNTITFLNFAVDTWLTKFVVDI